MAQAIKTVLTYNLDGATKDFNIPFEYLARKFVVVTLIGVDRKVLRLNQDYRFATRTTISTTLAWGPATGYQQIEIRRYTSATERLVDFTDGSILRAYDLNVAQVQTLHVAEEARDLTADTIGVNNDGNLDARGRRIVNLADAVLDSDAISFGQVKRMNENSWQARNEALQFRNEAEAFKNEAGTNAANTLQWRNETEQFKGQAQGFRNEAENFKNQAAASQVAAAGSAQSAANSQAAAATSEGNALAQANRATSEADRAKTEADKLGNWNALGAAIDSVSGFDITFKGQLVTSQNISGGGLISTGHAQINKGLVVGEAIIGRQDITAQRDIYSQRNLTVSGNTWLQGGLNQTLATTVYNQLYRIHLNNTPMHVGDRQGIHIGWNESNRNGEAMFINNQGGGDGGFVFRTVNNQNTIERGRVTFTQYGAIHAGHFQVGNGARIEANNNIVGQEIFSGMGSARLAADGNLFGSMWGGNWLSNYLNNKYLFAKPPAGVQLYTGRGGDYLEGNVDGTAVGFRWFSSDRRLKEDLKVVRDADDMLNIIRSYIPVSYKYKDKTWTDNRGRSVKTVGKRSRAGFITQDLIRLWPEAVDVMSDGMQSPDPNQIIGGLMLLVKNLDERVQALEAERESK